MISALCWVPAGIAKQFPERYTLDEEEFQRISNQIGTELQSIKQEMESTTNETNPIKSETTIEQDSLNEPINSTTISSISDDLSKYNLDTYDEEETQTAIPLFGNIKGLSYYNSNEQDPYITLDHQQEDDERLELEIYPTDNLLLACKTDDDISHLEVYVYEEKETNLFVHHDIMLPSFPLCVEWMNSSINNGSQGSFVAIGTFEPEIEIWDLDTVDVVYPTVILGSSSSTTTDLKKKKKNKQKQKQSIQPDRHISAVTSLSWNKTQMNLLLSGSIDSTIKLWDLNTCTAVASYNHHKDKVSAIAWNPSQVTVFLSGGYDQKGRVCALDSRVSAQVASWSLGSDVECLLWDPFRPERFLVSTENGMVHCYDARQFNSTQTLYTLHAHDAAVSSLDFNTRVDGLLVTGSSDKTVKVWDVREGNSKSCLVSRDLGVGKVFASQFCMNDPFILAASGSKGNILLWNLQDNPGVRGAFNSHIKETDTAKPEIIKIDSDGEDSEHEDEQMEE